MTTMLELHQSHFDVGTGAFDSKGFASIAAEQIRRMLHSKGYEDSRYVRVEGKHTFTIEIPRIRHVWWPRDNTAKGLAVEMEEVLRLFKEAFSHEDQNAS